MNKEFLINRKKEIIDQFWALNDNDNLDKDILKYYNENLELWLNNAQKIRNAYPNEVTEFWASIIKSNFFFKLIIEDFKYLYRNFNFNNITNSIRFIKNIYESSYQYFFYLTVCSNFTDNYIDNLCKFWSIPSKAKEAQKNDINIKPWKHGRNCISGKYWVLLNCSLFQFFKFDIKCIKNIKDADSHEKLIIHDDEIINVLKKEPEVIKKADLLYIVKYLKTVLLISIHFSLKLFIEQNYWTTPILFITNSEKLKSKKNLFNYTSKLKNKKFKPAKSNLNYEDLIIDIVIVFELLLDFTREKMWAAFKKDKVYIDNYLQNDNLVFDESQLDQVKEKSKDNEIEFLKIIINKSYELCLKEDRPPSDIDDLNKESLINELLDVLQKLNSSSNTDDKFWGLISLGLYYAYSLLEPISTLRDNINSLMVEKIA